MFGFYSPKNNFIDFFCPESSLFIEILPFVLLLCVKKGVKCIKH